MHRRERGRWAGAAAGGGLLLAAACGLDPLPQQTLDPHGNHHPPVGSTSSGDDTDTDAPDPDLPPPGERVQNIIFLMGDGMGPGHVEAGRVYRHGPDVPLAMETLDHHSTVTTFSYYGGATDSSAAATAMATGVLIPNSMVAMDLEGAEIPTVLEHASELGMSTGLITKARIHDASPASFSAHSPSRWAYQDIIEDMYLRSRPHVLLGGGQGGWGTNDSVAAATAVGYVNVSTAAELEAVELADDQHLLGLFAGAAEPTGDVLVDAALTKLVPETLTPELARDGTQTDPRLPDMVARALELLETDPEGFFLFIENEHIDELSHSSGASQAATDALMPYLVEEVAVLDETVELVLEWIDAQEDPERTLFIVTADHDCCGLDVIDGAYVAGDVVAATCSSGGHTTLPVHLWATGYGAERADDAITNLDIFSIMNSALLGE